MSRAPYIVNDCLKKLTKSCYSYFLFFTKIIIKFLRNRRLDLFQFVYKDYFKWPKKFFLIKFEV